MTERLVVLCEEVKAALGSGWEVSVANDVAGLEIRNRRSVRLSMVPDCTASEAVVALLKAYENAPLWDRLQRISSLAKQSGVESKCSGLSAEDAGLCIDIGEEAWWRVSRERLMAVPVEQLASEFAEAFMRVRE